MFTNLVHLVCNCSIARARTTRQELRLRTTGRIDGLARHFNAQKTPGISLGQLVWYGAGLWPARRPGLGETQLRKLWPALQRCRTSAILPVAMCVRPLGVRRLPRNMI